MGGKKYHGVVEKQGKRMIIDCIADLHSFYPKLEGGDLLIIAGDLTGRDTDEEQLDFIVWLAEIQRSQYAYNKIVYIAGNHDNFFSSDERHGALSTPDEWDIDYLCDSGTEFEGLKIWGSPWTKTFPGMNSKCKAFTVDTEEELDDKWNLIPIDTDILITHGPPYGILDLSVDGECCGSKMLQFHLFARLNPKLMVFGHIHESYGRKEADMVFPLCVNASHVNERYKPVNAPVRIIL